MNIKYLLLLKDIVLNEKTGELTAVSKKSVRSLGFQKGEITYCATTREKERILNIMYDELNYMGKKRYKGLLKYLSNPEREKIKLGQKLVFDKIITSSQLYTALIKQAEIIALNISKEKNNINFTEKPMEQIKNYGFKIPAIKILSEVFIKGKIDKNNEKLLDGKILVKEENRLYELLSEKDRDILEKLKKNKKITKQMGKKVEIIRIIFKLYILGYINVVPIEKNGFPLDNKKMTLKRKISNKIFNNLDSAINNEEKIDISSNTTDTDSFVKDSAIKEKKIKGDDKEDITVILKKAKLLYNNRKYKEVVNFIKDIPNYDELSGKIILQLAKAESKIEIYKPDAEKRLLSLIKKEPWVKESYYELLSLYEQENLTSRAKPIIEKALKFFPDEHEFNHFKEVFLKSKKIKLFS